MGYPDQNPLWSNERFYPEPEDEPEIERCAGCGAFHEQNDLANGYCADCFKLVED
jgi:hypothetical protein